MCSSCYTESKEHGSQSPPFHVSGPLQQHRDAWEERYKPSTDSFKYVILKIVAGWALVPIKAELNNKSITEAKY